MFSQWIIEQIKDICLNYRRRSAGSESVRQCMNHMSEQMNPWSDQVSTHAFRLSRHPFVGSIPLLTAGGICGIICFWLSCLLTSKILAVLSPVLLAAAFLIWFVEFVLYREAIDFLCPKYHSFNVLAERKAKIESRQRIIIAGHADAAYEMTFFLKFRTWQIYALIILAILGMLTCFTFGIIHALGIVSPSVLHVFCAIEAPFLLVFIPWLFFVNWKCVVDGANDNLTGCYIGMSILKEMSETEERMNYTDVCCLITDGEESGLRGAAAYAKQYRRELTDSNTIVIALDTIHDPKELAIYHRGINFIQKNSPEVCKLLKSAGDDCGTPLPYTEFYPGATDAEAFSRYGIKAAAICAVQHSPTTYYHTRHDSWDNLNEECISMTRNIIKRAIQICDAQNSHESDHS